MSRALPQRLRAWWAAHIIDADPCDAPAPHGVPLRAGWEDEPIVVPHHWPLYLLAFLVGMLCLGSCATSPPTGPSPNVETSCPHPSVVAITQRDDEHARALVQANTQLWYERCRNAALTEYDARNRSIQRQQAAWPARWGMSSRVGAP